MKVLASCVLAAAALAATPTGAADSSASGAGTVTAASDSTTTSASGSGSAANDFMASLTDNYTNSDSFHMTPVHVVQARVAGDMPVWNAEAGRFVSEYYTDVDEAFRDLMDTVNTASVEGALMYVQAECINYNERSTEERCTRKNDATYVVFYEMAIVQTNETLALYEDTADQNEYGPMLPMDSGRCTPTSGDGSNATFPTACLYFNGDDGEPDVGPFVGGETKSTDARAPYPNNVWYSFPNTCPLETWDEKTDSCRSSTRAGLCPLGVMPDGITCTFNYRVLGFILIDDLVGITSMTSNSTGEYYSNFTEFCEDGGVEFEADTSTGEWEASIAFWENPQDSDANSARATKLVEAYYNLTNGLMKHTPMDSDTIAHMLPLPTIAELRAENPPCYKNVKKCNSDYGCVRELYGQTCTVCNSTSSGCETAPSSWTFPTLTKAVGDNGNTGTASGDGSSTVDGSAGTSSSTGSNGATSASATTLVTLAALAVATLTARS